MTTRISTSQIFRQTQDNVLKAREKEAISAEKTATSKEIVRPSQDPSGWLLAADLKDDLSKRDIIAKNGAVAVHMMNRTEDILSRVQEFSQRAHELALTASGQNPASVGSRKQVVEEVKTIYDGIIQSVNTKFGNRTLLAGFKSNGPAFTREGKFVGDQGAIELEISPGLKMPLNLSGKRAILGEGVRGGTNILETMRSLIEGLEENDTDKIHGTLGELMKANEQLSLVRGELGGRMNELHRSLENHSITRIDTMEAISKIEDADAIKVFSELARDQNVLKAAISSSQKLLNETPADILFK